MAKHFYKTLIVFQDDRELEISLTIVWYSAILALVKLHILQHKTIWHLHSIYLFKIMQSFTVYNNLTSGQS